MPSQPSNRLYAGLLLLSAIVVAASTMAAQNDGSVALSGTLMPGRPGETPYTVLAPAGWNGTLVLDLDFVTSWNPVHRQWFLEHGYAIGGIRRANNEASYAIRDYIDNLLSVRRALVERTGRAPSRTIATGVSRGAYVALAAIEAEPAVFDGAVALSGGSLGLVGRMLSKLDRTWALKTLVDPASPLTLVNLPALPLTAGRPAPYAEDIALTALVERAKSTPLGRARLMLAASFDQVPRWGTRGSTLPAADDYDAQLTQVVDNFGGGFNQSLRWAVETAAGGNVSWNENVDYAALLQRSGLSDLVEYAYRSAQADLDADLKQLARAPRIRADEAALRRASQRLLLNSGRVRGPVLIGTTEGDPAEPPSIESAYTAAVTSQCEREKGQACGELLRTVYSHRPGHASWSVLERVTLFQALVNRLDAGRWGSGADLPLLQSSAARLKSATAADLGDERFVTLTPAPALRTWDARDAR